MTAVEWLIDTLRQDGLHIPKIYESVAEQKEKQQIINAYLDGNYDNGMGRCKEEQYYNEIFKKIINE